MRQQLSSWPEAVLRTAWIWLVRRTKKEEEKVGGGERMEDGGRVVDSPRQGCSQGWPEPLRTEQPSRVSQVYRRAWHGTAWCNITCMA
jgi:hypothetical protein